MINVIIGTRSQLMKMAPVLRYFNQQKQACQLVFTGQHSQSINETLNYFQLKKTAVVLFFIFFNISTHLLTLSLKIRSIYSLKNDIFLSILFILL